MQIDYFDVQCVHETIAIDVNINPIKHVIDNFDNHKKKWKITCVYAHNCITIQHQYRVFMYAKFTISNVVQMNLCRLLAHVLMLEKGGSSNVFVFAYVKWVLIFFVWKYVGTLNQCAFMTIFPKWVLKYC